MAEVVNRILQPPELSNPLLHMGSNQRPRNKFIDSTFLWCFEWKKARFFRKQTHAMVLVTIFWVLNPFFSNENQLWEVQSDQAMN